MGKVKVVSIDNEAPADVAEPEMKEEPVVTEAKEEVNAEEPVAEKLAIEAPDPVIADSKPKPKK